ncbi:2Fe-2S iron-sulfur cluster-binding protein [Maribacter cobaltidurans]|uniref:2Fe-2S iron-sulfur cluster-binding protein n=1 Tax=Maribacter cobaltidurans TaxID=1178778 RepID=UPI0027E48F43|nr:2Fe-2S iron-sulfur cluster-binding protein [Maribacter cobaltidurans]
MIMASYSLNINGTSHEVNVAQGTSLLWVLREHLGLTGTKYSCGKTKVAYSSFSNSKAPFL